jgi:hypothetical protein
MERRDGELKKGGEGKIRANWEKKGFGRMEGEGDEGIGGVDLEFRGKSIIFARTLYHNIILLDEKGY